MTYEKVGVVGDFEEATLYSRRVGGKPVLVTRANGRFYALSDACTHHGFSITPGRTDGKTLLCPVHGGVFDIESGEATGGPPGDPLTVYSVRVEGEDVLVGQD